MGEVINLRLARKSRARADATRSAEAARAMSGERKVAKQARKAEADRAARLLDGAKRETD
jgi:Domain of unknown function (DUF4169)